MSISCSCSNLTVGEFSSRVSFLRQVFLWNFWCLFGNAVCCALISCFAFGLPSGIWFISNKVSLMVGWPTRPQSVSLFRFELPLGECGCSMGLFGACLGFSLLVSGNLLAVGSSSFCLWLIVWLLDVLFGFQSCSWGTNFLTSLFSAGSLSAGLLATCLSFSLPVERHSVGLLLTCLSFSLPAEGHFLNKTPFRGESFC